MNQAIEDRRDKRLESPLELTILMPCLNEAETLAACIDKASHFLRRSGVVGEIVVADNGSTDGSQEIARRHGARVVPVREKGYGSALLGGISAARGRFVIMGDADDSYDFSALETFVERLRDGAELVMGNRFRGGIESGAMPIHHRYLGNPVLTGLGNLFFNSHAKDFHCGLRGFVKSSIDALCLTTPGMEFASEMVVKAILNGLKIEEVPTRLARDGRSRAPHLRSWHDGWRHLRFLLLHTPRWLFLYPGLALMITGFSLMVTLVRGPLRIGSIGLDHNTLLYSGFFFTVGLQLLVFSVITKVFGARVGLWPRDAPFEHVVSAITLERGLAVGAVLTLSGIVGSVLAFEWWSATSFGQLDFSRVSHLTIPSITALASGLEVTFATFFLHIIKLGSTAHEDAGRRRNREI